MLLSRDRSKEWRNIQHREMELSKITQEIFSRLEQKWLSHCEDKKTRILSIDGGGTKGFVAGAALIHLEDQIQAKTGDSQSRISDFFDVLAGTGIGAIFSAMLTADDGKGRPLFTARDAVQFVQEKHSEMFKVKHGGIFRRRCRFSSKNIEKVLKDALTREDGKVLTLKDTCKPLLVPCYDLNSSAPFVFSRADASESPSFDFELWKVCCATSATPSLFKPFNLTSIDGKTSCLAIDGGLVMNNPTAAAVTHALHNKRDFPSVNGVQDLLVLSLGNGPSSGPSLSRRKLQRNGECSTPLIVDIVLDGVSETVDQMLGNAFCWNRTDYVRIQANGFVSEYMKPTMDGVLKERGVESLPFGGKRLLTETNGQRIERFVQRFVASSGNSSSLPPSPCKETAVSPLASGR
ncbi:probable inactive patatin-like protein 9 [Macadamia integrifolia]|uniref:probable inactive patatin-like protein 9 n=1 Tax=Macadamia integrifolia TaxID=60698 RepID=UPI001C4E67D1|nr:probable inactive patatin-like protein 9 [Macadamia integrifolia]